MSSKLAKKLIAGTGIGALLVTVLFIPNTLVEAQSSTSSLRNRQPKKYTIELKPGQTRTNAAMRSAEANAPKTAKVASSLKDIANRPTIPQALLNQLKAQAAQNTTLRSKPAVNAPARNNNTLATVGSNCEGNRQSEGLFPPDTHGAVGSTQFVEVTNSRIGIFNKSDCSTASSLTLASFFGYSAQTLFDPRAVYDSTWKRWVVTAEAFQENSTTQYHFIAISTTDNAAGSYYIYALNVSFSFNNYGFWDYPQLGLDQNSVLITANIFPNSGGVSSNLLSISKARLYNGLGWSIPVFINLEPSLAPPIVLDQKANTFLIAAPPTGNQLKLYTLSNSSNAYDASLSGPANITVPTYSVPPKAKQPGTTDSRNEIDTLDSRFVNVSTQVGDSLWQVHTVALGSWPAPKYYEIDTKNKTVKQSQFFYASGTSYDWNASIVNNGDSTNPRTFVNWSSTNPNGNVYAQVRAADCNATSCSFGSGVALFTSSTFLSGNFQSNRGAQRWGDYSAITLDPSNSSQACLVNEKINNTNEWGSRFGCITP